jgi:hypothetical protein
LTFLEQRGIITKEFQYRFVTAMIRQARQEADDYFPCPTDCGNFVIVDHNVAVFNILMQGSAEEGFGAELQLGECPCGALLCMKCRNEEKGAKHVCRGVQSHREAGKPTEEQMAETILMLGQVGKKCPVCSMFIQKNEGCHVRFNCLCFFFCETKTNAIHPHSPFRFAYSLHR